MGFTQWPNKVNLGCFPTPFLPLRRKTSAGVRVWLKRDDLSGFTGSGNKLRKLEFVLAAAKAAGCSRIITCGGEQSNHCRATAFACASQDLKVHLVLREASRGEGGNLLLDRLAGADISLYSQCDYSADLSALLERWRQHYLLQGEKSLVVPTGASDGLGIWGYVAAAFEMLADFKRVGISPRYVFCASGSGGTQAGLALGFALAEVDIQVVGIAVCDNKDYFDKKVLADIADWQERHPSIVLRRVPNFETIDRYVGLGYAKATTSELQNLVRMAAEEGVLFDPVYTNKAFRGLEAELMLGRFAESPDIVFVHTGGGFGVFPYESELAPLLKPNLHKI